jgi:methyl-accepting chemotaxis protein
LQAIATSATATAEAITRASQGLTHVHERHSGIAASAEEQAASSLQVSHDLRHASEQTERIAAQMSELASGAAAAAQAVTAIVGSGIRMTTMAEELTRLVATKRVRPT